MAGTKNWSAGDVLNAADLNSVSDQVVFQFADSAARDAGFGGAGEPTLQDGMCCVLLDTDTLQSYDGSAWRPVGQTAWSDYTPSTVTWSGAFTISRTLLVNRTVFWRARFTLDATPSGTLTMTPPYTYGSYSSGGVAGSGYAYDTSLDDAYAIAPYGTGGNIQFIEMQSTSQGAVTSTNPFTWVSGDSIRFLMIYEQA